MGIFKLSKLSNDRKISLLICAILSFNVITLFINSLINFIMPNTPIDTIICIAIFSIFVLMSLTVILSRMNYLHVLVLIFVSIILIINLLLYPQNSKYITNYFFDFYFRMFTLFLIGSVLYNIEDLFECLDCFYRVPIICGTIYYLVALVARTEINIDNMSFAYYYLPFTIYALYKLFAKRTFSNTIYFFAALFTIVLAGTRGPLMCIIVFFLLYVILQSDLKNKLLIVFMSLAGGAYVYSDYFLINIRSLNIFLNEQFDFRSRIFEYIINQDILNKSNRNILSDRLIEAIQQRPLRGYGIMGDRVITHNILTVDRGTYAHNLFIELFVQYGVIIGTLLLLSLFLLILRSYYKNNLLGKNWILILVSISIAKLVVSGSYLFEPMLFLLIGFGCNNSEIHTRNSK